MSGEDEAYVGRRVFTSSENVKMDDAEVEANEQMMKNAKCVWGGRGRKFSQCQMEEQLALLSLLWGWIFPYRTVARTRSHGHACRATSCHPAPPARQLVIKASILASLIGSE